MIKARNKKLSMLLVLAMLMTMFVGVGAVSAASTYDEVIVQSVSASGATLDKAKFAINVPDVAALSNGSLLTIHLPSGIIMDNEATEDGDQKVAFNEVGWVNTVTGAIYNTGTVNAADINVSAPRYLPDGTDNALATTGSFVAYAVGDTTLEVKIVTAPPTGVGLLYVEFQNVLVDDTFEGDIKANILTPDGSGFSNGAVCFAKFISGGGGTQAIAKSVVSMGEDTKALDTIMIQETVKNSIESGENIKIKLPAGFSWASTGKIVGAWAFTGKVFTSDIKEDGRTLVITAPTLGSLDSEGRIYIDKAQITVSDTDIAKMGDVIVDVYSDLGNVTDQEVVVATYKDYDVVVEAAREVEVTAGQDDVTLGDIKITENLAGSILPNRTIKLTLPSGVKWHVNSTSGSAEWPENLGINPFTFESLKGSISLSDLGGMPAVTSNNDRTIKLTVGNGPFNKSSFLLKKLKVTISPDFAGDLNVEVSGTAGVEGTVKVATVKPPVELVADGKAELIIGAQAQVAGDIIIKETAKEAIDVTADTPHLIVNLPTDAKWYSDPKVEVTEGDLVIDKIDTDGRSLTINFKASSTEPSEITISDVKITLNRNLPEGDFKVSISSASNAIVENADKDKFDVSTIVSAVLGQCVTPAPGETIGSCEFKIGSNIYYAGGTAKVMDVAPYIKGDRTYVPMRYLGEVLGAEVVWDDAARTVTLTKGEDVVVFTIGSATYTLNGEAKTADVAPEIVNSRTMLPARFVAEAFGAQVGWDAGTQTVLIQK